MRIHIHGQADRFTGWGLLTAQAVQYLQNKASVTFTHQNKDSLAGDDDLPYGPKDGADVVLQILPVDSPVIDGSIVWTMHEASRIPHSCVKELNKAKAIFVPSTWNADGFRESGVTRPIHIVTLGYDRMKFWFCPKKSGPLVFGTGGSISGAGERKEVQKVIDAFHHSAIDARLEVKIFPWDRVDTRDDARISVIQHVWTEPDQLGVWHRSLDCFVSASRGEGFGLMPLQALVCGADVIAPIFGGHATYMSTRTVHALPFTVGPASGFYQDGDQCCVEVNDITTAMIRVAQIRQEEPYDDRLSRTMMQSLAVSSLTWTRAFEALWLKLTKHTEW